MFLVGPYGKLLINTMLEDQMTRTPDVFQYFFQKWDNVSKYSLPRRRISEETCQIVPWIMSQNIAYHHH